MAVPATAVAGVARNLLADGARRTDAVVTDVSGVKTAIVAEADHARFVGGHPMAGSEQIGLRGADPDLFEGAVWVLTPTAATDLASFDRLKGVVMSLGADVLVLSASDHDRLVAVVSHVPHLVAATLMNAASAGAQQDGALLRLAAGGFRDMTRVAAGHPGIWPDICAENAGAIVDALDTLIGDLSAVRDEVAGHDRAALLGHARVGQRGPAQPARPHRPARPPGRAAHPRGRRARRRGRAHLAGRRRRHQPLRLRGRPLRRGPPRRAHPRGRGHRRRSRWPPPSRPAATAAGWSRCRDAPIAPAALVVEGGVPCHGTVRTPGEKSISHRSVLLGARWPRAPRSCMASPTARTWLPRWPRSRPWASPSSAGSTARSCCTAGAACSTPRTTRSTAATRAPPCASSAGLVAGLPWVTELVGDESLSARPMDRVAEPLGLMGADVRGQGERCLPPLRVEGGALHGIDWTSKVASAQVKSAILLAGLSATGETVVREAVTTRTHTEEMLGEAGADLTVEPWGEGRVVTVRASTLRPVDRTVPGDPSASAFFVVAGCVAAAGDVQVAEVYDGPARLGFMQVLARMGADVTVEPTGPHVASLHARPGPLRATEIAAPEIPSLDEVPILAVAAAVAEGTTVFTDVGELRVKEVDRLAAVADMVEAFGATATVEGDTLSITGRGGPLRGARFDSRGDHRMAMAAAVAALAAAPGERSIITGFRAVETSYPGFADDLRRLTEGDRPAAGAARRHRRSGRGGQVDRSYRGGPPTRPRPARYGSHVPLHRRPRLGRGSRPRRRTGRGRTGRGGHH